MTPTAYIRKHFAALRKGQGKCWAPGSRGALKCKKHIKLAHFWASAKLAFCYFLAIQLFAILAARKQERAGAPPSYSQKRKGKEK